MASGQRIGCPAFHGKQGMAETVRKVTARLVFIAQAQASGFFASAFDLSQRIIDPYVTLAAKENLSKSIGRQLTIDHGLLTTS